jgi:hypothetical protein
MRSEARRWATPVAVLVLLGILALPTGTSAAVSPPSRVRLSAPPIAYGPPSRVAAPMDPAVLGASSVRRSTAGSSRETWTAASLPSPLPPPAGGATPRLASAGTAVRRPRSPPKALSWAGCAWTSEGQVFPPKSNDVSMMPRLPDPRADGNAVVTGRVELSNPRRGRDVDAHPSDGVEVSPHRRRLRALASWPARAPSTSNTQASWCVSDRSIDTCPRSTALGRPSDRRTCRAPEKAPAGSLRCG